MRTMPYLRLRKPNLLLADNKSSAKISKLSLIALDVLWGILSVAAFASVVFFLSNGETHPFMVISMVVGFSMTAVFY